MPLYGSTPATTTTTTPTLPPDHEALTPEVTLIKAQQDLYQAARPGYGTRNRLEISFNLVNATVGAGIIGIPFAIYHAGFIFGIAVSVLVAIISQLGLYMLIMAGRRVEIYKYADLTEYLMGRSGYYFLNITLLVQSVGITISYFILMGDTLPVLINLYFPGYNLSRELIVCLISLFLVFPLNLPRSIGALARWSVISVLCIPVIILVILIRAPVYIPDDYVMPITWTGPDVFGALGIIAFAFACPHVAFNNYLSQRNQSSRAWYWTTVTATVMSWTVTIMFALVGYLSFGDKVYSNLFLNFAPDDGIINIGRFALGFSMILTIPMGFYPTRECTQKLIGLETADRHPSKLEHFVVTVVVFGTLLYFGITVQSLGKVYALVGGFAATTLAYIIPGAAYLFAGRRSSLLLNKQLTEDEADTLIDSPSKHIYPIILDIAAGLLIIWGLFVMVVSTTGVFTTS
ncbi:transmembrane amino acid transporter protein-domain-containing protein [Zychaea mexicana]|uniref:transmembrane amino acid transporter protein-domain-containing protein n=1 Tax=Zychaea mexicana TaxID=64656 RepID=UPI0022FE234B|nr:transmembrane amino acid transporter protein-domain-containing protein [Zychaea mexicana]KAI9493792.1 transmembrane amino acid transporter protein-domain-containing protein [Zychaea mexicana]